MDAGAPQVGLAWLIWRMRLHVAWDSWPPGPTRPTLPAPVEPKPKAMPPEDHVGLDDDERVPPAGPQVTEARFRTAVRPAATAVVLEPVAARPPIDGAARRSRSGALPGSAGPTRPR